MTINFTDMFIVGGAIILGCSLEGEGMRLHHCAVFIKILGCSLNFTSGWLTSR